ncbi:MAG: shikimate kinase [Verrucomicrobia bacterium]|jgi:shikimate kinase|nr:MAG: shikimate kinase [Verrucomicrobiota bacterium]
MRYCIINCRNKSIVLIGMMGAGKSSVGRCLQLRTKLALVDIDDIVASHFGTSIPEIFSKYGEQVFREIETQALREMAPAKQTIIATGGGIVVRKENMHLLKQLGIVVWLDCNEETLFERAWRSGNRPLLRAENPREAFARMLQARLPLYAKIAQIRVDTSMLTDEEVAVAIVSKLRKLGRNWRPGSPIPPTR